MERHILIPISFIAGAAFSAVLYHCYHSLISAAIASAAFASGYVVSKYYAHDDTAKPKHSFQGRVNYISKSDAMALLRSAMERCGMVKDDESGGNE